VTTALYLKPTDIDDSATVASMFTSAVGLDPDLTTSDPWK